MTQTPIKILHVLDSLAVGGMERVVIDVVNGLKSSQFTHAVCCVSRLGEAARHVRAEVACHDMGKGGARDLLMPFKLAQVMRREQPDIVHTQSWSGVDGVLAGKIARVPRIVHSEHGRNLPYIHFEPTKRKIVRRMIYHLADAVFTISDEMRHYYCRETGFPLERMHVIPNGVDVARFDAVEANGVREELGLMVDDFVIGIVSRLNPTKDVLTLARAFARLVGDECEPRLKLLIIGDGEGRAELENFAAERGLNHAMIFTGTRHDVPRLLRAMNVFALSSLSEGMPVTVLEAMCASLPVVATNVGANPELIAEGETGFLVEPRDDEALAERLGRLLADRALARKLGAAGHGKIVRDYSLKTMLRRYEELYLSLMQR